LRIVPRSLLGRTASVLVLALIAIQLVNLVAFRLYQSGPTALQLAVLATHHLKAVAAALDTLPADQRGAYLEHFRDNAVVHVERARPGPLPGHPPLGPALVMFERNLREQLGPETRLYVAEGPPRVLWVTLVAGGDTYWVSFAGTRIERGVPWRWIVLIAASAAVAFLSSVWLVKRINRPLEALAAAAAAIVRGEHPQPLPETGPEELASLSRSFNRMSAHLAEAERDRTLMLAGVSHDIRTPLARLRLGIEMNPSADADMREGMVQDVEDIDRIIGQFLDYARDGTEESPRPVDLVQLAEEGVAKLERRGIATTLNAESARPVIARPLALKRALDNLLENAARHGAAPVSVDLAQTPDGGATMYVRDRGKGIPEGEIDRLLRPFTRRDEARGNSTGTGLGLAIVARIARAHGGTLKLSNREGGGLEARLDLPWDGARQSGENR